MKPSELIAILEKMDPEANIYVVGFGDRITHVELDKYYTVPTPKELGEENDTCGPNPNHNL